jgi:hypothetical protein
MTKTDIHTDIDDAPHSPNTYGIDPDNREQLLLDDLRVEIERLADAVERQNELLGKLETAHLEERQ